MIFSRYCALSTLMIYAATASKKLRKDIINRKDSNKKRKKSQATFYMDKNRNGIYSKNVKDLSDDDPVKVLIKAKNYRGSSKVKEKSLKVTLKIENKRIFGATVAKKNMKLLK